MDITGKDKLLQNLRERAEELHEWMYEHTSPETPASEFDKVANEYAILCMRIYIIEKQW